LLQKNRLGNMGILMKLLLADDHTLFREGFSMIISSTATESKISLAASWGEAQAMVKKQDFDIAFLDLFMPGAKPWDEELSAFISSAPRVAVCIVSSSNNQSHVRQAFKLGAKGYIRKTSDVSEVRHALSRLISGDRYIPSSNWRGMPQAQTSSTASFKLTWRQREILMLITEGNSNKEIATILDITESTVKRHVYNLFKALDAKNRMSAMKIAKSRGLLLNQ